MTHAPTGPDFEFENHGTIWIVQPMNASALKHLRANANTESWQWMGSGLAVDHRYAEQLAEQLEADGFAVRF